MLNLRLTLVVTGILAGSANIPAQPPPMREGGNSSTVETFVSRMMAFDANHDGKLIKSEITDERLFSLFDRADADSNGVVTIDELKAFYAKESAAFPNGGAGRGGPGERQQPGQVLPLSLQRMLALTPAQTASLAILQHEVDAKLNALLSTEQKARLRAVGQRGPREPGFGPGGGGMPRRPGEP